MARGSIITASNGSNDLSDSRLIIPAYSEVSATQLPIRGEKRIVTTYGPAEFDYDSYVTSGALAPFVDYCSIRLPHRGLTAQGKPDPNHAAVFRFLINPTSCRVNKQTVDFQALTRAGWQFGVWGEDTVTISVEGKTAGQYFANGLTDEYGMFTKSYRNLQQLIMVMENNGYFFEGEEAGEGPMAADFTRRRIKSHQDVEMTMGNLIWYGMFDSLQVTQDAENPLQLSFSFQFMAWKQRFRSGSPYWDNIHNDVQRGHTYDSFSGGSYLARTGDLPDTMPLNNRSLQASQALLPSGTPQAPAVQSAGIIDTLPFYDTSVTDTTYLSPLFNPGEFF